MNALIQAIYSLLIADSALTGMLNTYNGTPAVFSSDFVPEDALMPYVNMFEAVDEPFDTKTGWGREIVINVMVWAKPAGSAKDLNAMAERIRQLLHRSELTVTGFNHIVASASGPIPIDPDPQAWGRAISLRVILMEV